MSQELSLHAPGEPRKISYPGGKNGWMRVDCVHPSCDYEATESLAHRAVKRVQAHANAQNANAQNANAQNANARNADQSEKS